MEFQTDSETWETVARLRNPRGGHGSSVVRVEDFNDHVIDCTDLDSCGSPRSKGDNWCDDENNNEGCGWDGGDCCGDNVRIHNCSSCQCLDPTFYSEALNSNWEPQDLYHINSVTRC